jgi:cytochrome c2
LVRGKYAHFTIRDAVLKEGERLMERGACRRCHVSNRRGNRLAASLDTLKQSKTPEELSSAIRSPALGMPDFRFSDSQITALVNAVLSGQEATKVPKKELPLVLHLAGKKSREDIFTGKCGACHRVLSEYKGALGKSDSGPNLSGLLSPHYPKTYKSDQAWTVERLRQWLKNPRLTRPLGRMPPVALSEKEFGELVDILTVNSGTR